MRIKSTLMAVLGGVSLVSMSSAAFAGGCGYGAPADKCQPGVVVSTGNAPAYDPMTVQIQQPMGHLRSVQFNRSPNVSITRVHGMSQTAGLEDAPSAFTDGCNPTSTHYCRGGDVRPAPIAAPAPAPMPAPAPYIAPPMMAAPVMAAPVMAQPVYSAPRTVYVGQGYDPSKFQARQYGENTFTPGIAHVPTSYVDRGLDQSGGYSHQEFDHHAATAPAAPGIAPLVKPTIMTGSHNVSVQMMPGTMMQAPMMQAPVAMPMHMSAPAPVMSQPVMSGQMMGASNMGHPMMVGGPSAAPRNSGPVQTSNGLYASAVAPDGTYWEKTSGPTVFGSTIATQVICKRQLPTKTVRPVVGVPTPVPVNVGCAPVAHAPHAGHHGQQQAHAQAGYGAAPQGRWTY